MTSPAVRTNRPGRTSIYWCILITVVVGCLSAPLAGQTIRLCHDAVVTDSQVRLSDVADLRGFDAVASEGLGQMEITASPAAGKGLSLAAQELMDILSERGVNLATVQVSGASACCIRRVDVPEPQTPAPRLRPNRSSRALSANAGGPVTLREHVEAFIADRAAALGGEVELRFAAAAQSILELTSPPFEFRIQANSDQPLGMVSLQVQVIESGKQPRNLPLLVEVSLLCPVVVAQRPIAIGRIIDAGSLGIEPRVFKDAGDVGVTEVGEAIGQKARRYLPAGQMLTADALRPVPLVHRGDVITLWARSGPVAVQTTARAMEDGLRGETIRVRMERNRETLRATVTGPKTAELTAQQGALAWGQGS